VPRNRKQIESFGGTPVAILRCRDKPPLALQKDRKTPRAELVRVSLIDIKQRGEPEPQ
jgi:hypothetical protein